LVDRLTVMVLGVGGNVSQGILKALSLSSLHVRVVAGCVDPLSAGLFRADRSFVTPAASDAAFIPWLTETCEAEGVDAVLSGVEPVLAALASEAERLRERTGAVCVVSAPDILRIGGDKLQTCRWLRDRGLPHPRFAESAGAGDLDSLARACGYPLLAKPRAGKSAEGVDRIDDARELEELVGRDDLCVQEYLGDAGEEFTSGCFCDGSGRVRGTLSMRRQLLRGTTSSAEAGDFPEVRRTAARVVGELAPLGPCNVQSRVVGGRSIPFELNVRFSGTTPIRARLGFNEVDAALRHFVLGEPAFDLPVVSEGTAVRYWNEMYVPDAAVAALRRDGKLEDPRSEDVTADDWGARPSDPA